MQAERQTRYSFSSALGKSMHAEDMGNMSVT